VSNWDGMRRRAIISEFTKSANGKEDTNVYQLLLKMGSYTSVDPLLLAGIHGSLRFCLTRKYNEAEKDWLSGSPLARFKWVDHGDRT